MEKPVAATKKIRKGDRVLAMTGNSKDQRGVVLSIKGDRAVVQGLNLRKKCLKKTQQSPGRIIEIERPIHISNLKVCVDGDTAAKLKIRKNGQGQRELVYKNGDQHAVYRSTKKPK